VVFYLSGGLSSVSGLEETGTGLFNREAFFAFDPFLPGDV
jgi:hypothetical protein